MKEEDVKKYILLQNLPDWSKPFDSLVPVGLTSCDLKVK
jgi:hypothetical protein